MSQTINAELQEFALFVSAKIRSGHAPISPEEALDQWREEHPSLEHEREHDEKLLAALARFDAGVSAKPHEEFDREFRVRHGLRPQ